MDTEIKQIETLAKIVTEQAETLAKAAAENEAAETALMEHVVGKLRPALRALSSRIQTEENVESEDPDGPTREDRYYHLRGIYIPLSRPNGRERWLSSGPVEQREGRNGGVDDTAGPYVGTDLFLMEDGSWLELAYRGRWSRWQGAVSWWTATPRRMTLTDVVAEYNVPDVLGGLLVRLEGYVKGNATTRAQKLADNAAKIRAMLALL